jgi:hypothetical protein
VINRKQLFSVVCNQWPQSGSARRVGEREWSTRKEEALRSMASGTARRILATLTCVETMRERKAASPLLPYNLKRDKPVSANLSNESQRKESVRADSCFCPGLHLVQSRRRFRYVHGERRLTGGLNRTDELQIDPACSTLIYSISAR